MFRFLVLVCFGFASPALSLSCLPHSVEGTYQAAVESDGKFIVVSGVLSFQQSALPKPDLLTQYNPPDTRRVPARFKGVAMGHNGFDLVFDRAITLDAACMGPWCAQPISGTKYLAFLRKTAGGYELRLDACGGYGLPEPNREMLDRVQQCYKGQDCTPPRRR